MSGDPVCICLEDAKDAACDVHGRPMRVVSEGWLKNIYADPDFRLAMEECDKILSVKGHDYTQGSPNRLANFDEAADFLGLTPFRILGVYLYKHIVAVFSFLRHGRVESEPIEGRIHDVINYALLLYKMVKREKDRAASKDSAR